MCKFQHLAKLVLSRAELTAIPDVVCALTWLTSLDLSFNLLTSYPLTFSRLARLEDLFVNNNLLTELPVHLPNLRHLDVCFNKLKVRCSVLQAYTHTTTHNSLHAHDRGTHST